MNSDIGIGIKDIIVITLWKEANEPGGQKDLSTDEIFLVVGIKDVSGYLWAEIITSSGLKGWLYETAIEKYAMRIA